MTDQTQDNNANHPVQSHRDGGVEIAIWRRDTDKGPVFNTERTRSYQDKDGNWQKTHSIPERDLLKAARLDQQAYASIQEMREQERQKYIEQQKQASQELPSQTKQPER